MQKNWTESLEGFMNSLTIYEKVIGSEMLVDDISDKYLEAALSFNNQKRHEDSIALLQKLIAIFPSNDEVPKLGEIYGVIGDILIILKRY